MSELSHLSRREREIMETIFAKGKATASEVLAEMDSPPTRTAVRTFLSILEEKGQLRHTKRGREFVYHPIQERERTGRSALDRVLQTFFGGSLERAVASHLADPAAEVSTDELRRLSALINEAKRQET